MKHSLNIVLFTLLLCGVFGADEVKPVSVMEADSVTLTPDPAKIQGFIRIQWRFGEKVIAQTRRTESSTEYEDIFRDRLQLDNQTGSLTIKNMRTKHSGLYKLQIDYNLDKPSYIEFSVTVKESPSVDAIEFVMKTESVTEGEPVTLHVPQIQGDELIVWRFGDEGKLIAKHDIEAKNSSLYDETDERFRDRLKLDQTGSLTITNTRTNHSGHYTAKIISNKQTLYKRFIITVIPVPDPGYSGGAVAGIVVGVLLLAAAVAGVMYFYLRLRTTYVPNQTLRVTEGDDVTLDPYPVIQRGDEILWLFGDRETLIAEIKGENREMKTDKRPDEIFKNRLELDETTGSLIIKLIKTVHAGLYTLKIRRGRETFYKRFIVCVSERKITAMEGESVTLKHTTKINKDDMIYWLFGDEKQQTGIAELKVETRETFTFGYVADGRFRDRLELDKTTGHLTITNTRTAHSGVYKLQIRSSSGILDQIFFVTVSVEEKFLKEDSVTLKPDTKIQRDDQILWMFGDQDKLIAQIRGGTPDTYDGDDKRFRGRLELDEMTGSLTITKIEAKHTGLYKLLIISSSRGILCKKFKVLIQLRYETVNAGDSFRLYTEHPEIQRGDEIEWRFGDENSLIAEIKGGTGETHDGPDERFRDRLELDEKTGDLIIKNSRAEHDGRYKLKICSSEGNISLIFIVIIRDAAVTNEARTESLLKEKNDSRGNRVNESVTVEMEKDPLLNGDDLDVVNEEEGTSSL